MRFYHCTPKAKKIALVGHMAHPEVYLAEYQFKGIGPRLSRLFRQGTHRRGGSSGSDHAGQLPHQDC